MQGKVMINADIYTGYEHLEKGFIRFSEKIEEVGPMGEYEPRREEEVVNAEGRMVIPGMIDVHIHGGFGVDVMDADPEKLVFLSRELMKEGVTSFFATTITQEHGNIEKALRAVNAARDLDTSIEGVHLEGPFISEKRAGAQPLEYIVNPDAELFQRWQEASGNMIRLVTYAPEKPGARELEEVMLATGAVPSVGHSDGVREELLQSKASHATHLYNGMRGMHHREAGVAGHALLSPGIQAELIVDGIHSVPDMVRLAYRMKGAGGIVLISDAMRAKGMPDGEYELGGQKVLVADGQARLESGSLAGSVLTMDRAFRNMIEFTGCPVAEAVRMSSVNQAEEFGLEHKGALVPGKDADIVIMSREFEVEKTYRLGSE